MRNLIFICLLTFMISAKSASITGKVHAINVNKHPGWNGVLFQLAADNGQLLTVDPNCGNNKWAMFRMESNLDKAILSVLLTAKSTGTKVRISTSNCLNPPDVLTTIPEVQWIDLDIRD